MRTHHDLYDIARIKERPEDRDMGTRRVPHHQPGRQMDDLGTVLHYLLAGGLDVAAGTPIAGGIADQLYLLVGVDAEGAFPIAQRAQALPTRTTPVTVTDDDAQFVVSLIPSPFAALAKPAFPTAQLQPARDGQAVRLPE